jgi:2-polyprenyl-3-methyl-5-hydroxy-6-metoxy-1,4-benzoquinol methylase
MHRSGGSRAAGTTEKAYTKRLVALQKQSWKTILDVQRPYRWNLKRLNPGRTLDVGCGIGRCLTALPAGSVGIDHNPHSIDIVNSLGLIGFVADDFRRSASYILGGYDTLLLSHVLEHLTQDEGCSLIEKYAPLIKLGGLAILICPQEKGFSTDYSHVTFLDRDKLCAMLTMTGFVVQKTFSFPFPRILGRIFAYNETVVVGRKVSSNSASK